MRRTDGRVTVDVTDDGDRRRRRRRAARACAAWPTASPRSTARCRWRARPAAGRTCTRRSPVLRSVSGAARRLLPHRGKGVASARGVPARSARLSQHLAPGRRSEVGFSPLEWVGPTFDACGATRLLRNTRDRTPSTHPPEDDDARREPPAAPFPSVMLSGAAHRRQRSGRLTRGSPTPTAPAATTRAHPPARTSPAPRRCRRRRGPTCRSSPPRARRRPAPRRACGRRRARAPARRPRARRGTSRCPCRGASARRPRRSPPACRRRRRRAGGWSARRGSAASPPGCGRGVEQRARGVHRVLVAGTQAADLDVHARNATGPTASRRRCCPRCP